MMLKTISSILQQQNSVSSVSGKINSTGENQEIISRSNKLGSQLREINFSNETTGKVLQINRNYNLSIENNNVYSIPTKFGMINYKFNIATSTTSNNVELLHFDSQMSDSKRVHLERKRQFLQDLQTFIATGNPAYLYTAREATEVLEGFESFGVTTEEPFTINNDPKRYRICPSGILHDVDLESKTMREKDWRRYGHDENTVFLIQGKEYKMDENGRLPLPEDYVHKYEQVGIYKDK